LAATFFLAGAFLAATFFLAGAFLAATFFLAGAFLAATFFLAGAFLALVLAFFRLAMVMGSLFTWHGGLCRFPFWATQTIRSLRSVLALIFDGITP